MKIIIVTDIPIHFVCGSTNFVKKLAQHLIKRNHKVLFVCPGKSAHQESYTFEGVPVYGVASFPVLVHKYLRWPSPMHIEQQAEIIFNKFKPDVIHAQTHFILSDAILKIANQHDVPVIATNHFVPENVFYHFHLPSFFENSLENLGWKHLNRFLKKCDIVTTPTNTAARLLTESGFPKPVKVISNGIDLKKFHIGRNGVYLEKKYDLPKVPRLLYVGRLDPEKNVDTLLKSIPTILKKIDVHVIIVGRGAQETALKKLIDTLSIQHHVTFTGFMPDEDLLNIYSVADCFVMPGTAELQSLVTMEAMASGLPIIAADALALPELVHSGENGYLFKQKDSTDLARRVIQILSNIKLKNTMSKKGLEIIKQHDISATIKAFEALYRG